MVVGEGLASGGRLVGRAPRVGEIGELGRSLVGLGLDISSDWAIGDALHSLAVLHGCDGGRGSC